MKIWSDGWVVDELNAMTRVPQAIGKRLLKCKWGDAIILVADDEDVSRRVVNYAVHMIQRIIKVPLIITIQAIDWRSPQTFIKYPSPLYE